MLKIWAKDKSIVGRKFEDVIPEISGKPFTGLLKAVWRTDESFEGSDAQLTFRLNDEVITSYFDFNLQPKLLTPIENISR